jgi:hypothetical protein
MLVILVFDVVFRQLGKIISGTLSERGKRF